MAAGRPVLWQHPQGFSFWVSTNPTGAQARRRREAGGPPCGQAPEQVTGTGDGLARALLTPLPALGAATHRPPGPTSQLRALPTEGGLLDATLNWLLLDCTVVAVQDTEEVADEVAITTLFASMKASWKLYKHFFFAAFFFSLQSETAGVSLLAGGGRASGLVSESVGPSMSLPSEKNGKIKASKRCDI